MPFNSNTLDESGKNNNGINSNALLTTDRNNVSDKAFLFNGSSSQIRCAATPTLKRFNEDFTFSGWIRLDASSTHFHSAVLSNRNGNNGSMIAVTGALDGGGIRKFEYITSGGGAGGQSQAYSTTQLTLGTWYHCATTLKYLGNNSNICKIYINGILESTTIMKDLLDPDTVSTIIGFEPASSNAPVEYHFNGKLDDLRFYSRVLPDSQIMAIYHTNDLPAFTISPTNATIVKGNSIVIKANTNVYNYQWSGDSIINNWGDSVQLKPSKTTVYKVVGKTTTNCSDSISFTIVVDATGISGDKLQHPVSFFPNPVEDELQLTREISTPSLITVEDCTGKILFTNEWSDLATRIDVSHLAEGTYIVSIANTEGKSYFKFVKVSK